MLLGGDRDADGGRPAHDEKSSGHSGNAGTQTCRPGGPGGPGGWGSEPAFWPGHDHAEPGYAPPARVPQCCPLAFLLVFYPRSLDFTVMNPLRACTARRSWFNGRWHFPGNVLGGAALAILAVTSVSACSTGSAPTTPPSFSPGGPGSATPTVSASGTPSAATASATPGTATPGTPTASAATPSTTAPSVTTPSPGPTASPSPAASSFPPRRQPPAAVGRPGSSTSCCSASAYWRSWPVPGPSPTGEGSRGTGDTPVAAVGSSERAG